ncbi:MAG: gluconokinase [Anaerolineaceae bacterium]|nr:gluconokinase [Anaerolineaceae bacterium]
MELIIGLDLGTSNCKAVALALDGTLAASAESGHRLSTPQPGWAEERAEEVWQGAQEVLRTVAQKVDLRRHEFIGLCLSAAMHSLLPVDAEGKPLAPALTWADGRALAQAAALRQQTDLRHVLYSRTGCPLQPLYYPARLRWWFEQDRQTFDRAARFMGITDWLAYCLTGRWVTNYGLASGTGLLDIRTLQWDREALQLAGISSERLPQLVSPFAVLGGLLPEVAKAAGLPAGLPVIAGSSDGGLADLGAGAVTPGQSVITIGTSGAVRRVVAEPFLDESERTWCYLLAEQHWFAGGAINNGGLALQWVREHFYADLAGEAGYARLMQDAAEIVPGANGVFLLPYFTGERSPYWDAQVRALIYGLDLQHSRAHIARAVLEGVAFCLADVWQALEQVPATEPAVRLTGAITRSPVWMQILADVLGERLLPLEASDASVAGAAALGFKALGRADSLEALSARVSASPAVLPDSARHERYLELHQHFQQLYQHLAGI